MTDEPRIRVDRRAREHARELARAAKRRRRRQLLWSAVSMAIVVLVALVTTDTLRLGTTGPTLASGKGLDTTTTSASRNATFGARKSGTPPRPLSNAAPLRLWIGGDSLSGELGYQIGPMLARTGIVKTHIDYKISSGLASNDIRNWPQRFTAEAAQYQPETVVFMIGANDTSIVSSVTDPATGRPQWESGYRAKVDAMMQLLVGPQKRSVIWIGSPTLRSSVLNHGAQEVDRVMREEARKYPTITYFDAYTLFSSNGEYAVDLPDSHHETVQMRIGDGVHFSTAGAEFLADHIYKILDTRWRLATQRSPSTPIDYTIEEGGTISGTNLGHSSGGYQSTNTTSSSTSTSTSAPAGSTTTAPTATTAPTGSSSTTAPKSSTTVPSTTTTKP